MRSTIFDRVKRQSMENQLEKFWYFEVCPHDSHMLLITLAEKDGVRESRGNHVERKTFRSETESN